MDYDRGRDYPGPRRRGGGMAHGHDLATTRGEVGEFAAVVVLVRERLG